MNANTEFLDYIYQNTEMGKNTIKELIEINEDIEFSKVLTEQYTDYIEFNNEAVKLLKAMNEEPKGIGMVENFSSYIMIKVNTLTDKSPSHISDMLIQGSNMGVIDINKRLNDYKNVNAEIVSLARKLLKREEKNIEVLTKFL